MMAVAAENAVMRLNATVAPMAAAALQVPYIDMTTPRPPASAPTSAASDEVDRRGPRGRRPVPSSALLFSHVCPAQTPARTVNCTMAAMCSRSRGRMGSVPRDDPTTGVQDNLALAKSHEMFSAFNDL